MEKSSFSQKIYQLDSKDYIMECWSNFIPERYGNYLYEIDKKYPSKEHEFTLELIAIPDPRFEETNFLLKTRPKIVLSKNQFDKYIIEWDMDVILHNHPLTAMFLNNI
jgi:hypothetical protein